MVPWVCLQFVIVVFLIILNIYYCNISLLHVLALRTGFGLSCATSWLLLMLFLFKVVPEPGDKVSLPLYESTESCESLLQAEWQPDLSQQQNIFSLDYGMHVDIMC